MSLNGARSYHHRFFQATGSYYPSCNWETFKHPVKEIAHYEYDLSGPFLLREVPSETSTLESQKVVFQPVYSGSGTDVCSREASSFCAACSVPIICAPLVKRTIRYIVFPNQNVPSPRSDLVHYSTMFDLPEAQSPPILPIFVAHQLAPAYDVSETWNGAISNVNDANHPSNAAWLIKGIPPPRKAWCS